jgi:hypothetical protein
VTRPSPRGDRGSAGGTDGPSEHPGGTGLTAAQRSQRARIAALARWSREDPAVNARRGQDGLRASIAAGLDLPGDLHPDERERRIDAALRAHMSRLALASSRARTRPRRSS